MGRAGSRSTGSTPVEFDMPTDPVLAARAAIGVAARRGADTTTARGDLNAAKCERAIREAVAAAPPLTDAQRDRLAALLRGAR